MLRERKNHYMDIMRNTELFYNYYPQVGDIIYATMTHKLLQEQIYPTPSDEFMTPDRDVLGNMPLPAWTTNSLFQPICFNYLTRKSLRRFCGMKWKTMTFLVRI